MKVFLGWSGDTSHEVALALHNWLPEVIQAVKPWISSEDIAKGSRWAAEIATELQSSNFGIICVTRDNAKSPWINFEAGALSREIDKASVSPFLFNIKHSELQGPLAQFQQTANEEKEIFRLLSDINNRQEKDSRLGETSLKKTFEMWWPRLIEVLTKIEKERSDVSPPEKRSADAMLEELLELARGLQRDVHGRSESLQNSLERSRLESAHMFRDVLTTVGTLARNAELQSTLESTKDMLSQAFDGNAVDKNAFDALGSAPTGEGRRVSSVARAAARLAREARDTPSKPLEEKERK